jgi:hypothetical protein
MEARCEGGAAGGKEFFGATAGGNPAAPGLRNGGKEKDECGKQGEGEEEGPRRKMLPKSMWPESRRARDAGEPLSCPGIGCGGGLFI